MSRYQKSKPTNVLKHFSLWKQNKTSAKHLEKQTCPKMLTFCLLSALLLQNGFFRKIDSLALNESPIIFSLGPG